MATFKPVRQNLITILIYCLVIDKKLLIKPVVTDSTKDSSCQDVCSRSLMNFVNELKLDLKFATDLINDSEPVKLIEQKTQDLDTSLIELALGMDRTESSLANSRRRLLNLWTRSAEIATCGKAELTQTLTCITKSFDDNLTSLKRKSDLLVEYENLERKYTDTYSIIQSKFYEIQSLIGNLVVPAQGDYSNSTNIKQQIISSSTEHPTDEKPDIIQAIFNEQIKCGESINANLQRVEKIREQMTERQIKREAAFREKLEALNELMSETISGELGIYATIRKASVLIVRSLFKFSSNMEHLGVIRVAELVSQSETQDEAESLLSKSLELMKNAQSIANQTEQLIINLKIEELSQRLQKKIDLAKLMLDRVV